MSNITVNGHYCNARSSENGRVSSPADGPPREMCSSYELCDLFLN